jgi:uncharacterized membrane protein YccC
MAGLAGGGRRRGSAGEPVQPPHESLDAALALKRRPWPWRKAVGAPIATALAMGLGLELGHFDWGAWAFMGAFTSMYVTSLPYRARAVRLLWVGLGLAGALAIGSVASVSWATAALGLGVVAGVSTWLAESFDVPLPAGFMFVLVACIAAALPVDPALTPIRVAMALAGAAIAWVVGMAGWVWHPRGPEATAVAASYAALAQYAGRAGEPDGLLAADAADRTVGDGLLRTAGAIAGPRPTDRSVQLWALARQARRVLDAMNTQPPDDRRAAEDEIRQVVEEIRRGPSPRAGGWDDRPRAAPGRIGRELVRTRRLLARADRWPRFWMSGSLRRASAVEAPQRSPYLHRVVVRDALRIAIAVAVGAAVAGAAGESHPYWVALTAGAVLQGQTTMGMLSRGIQRVSGTTLGLLLAGLILIAHPSTAATVAAMVGLQFLLLFLILVNYGVAVIFVTALALVIIGAEVHVPVWPLLTARFVDTVLGVGVAVLALWRLWPRVASRRLGAAVVDLLERSADLAGPAPESETGHPLPRPRRVAQLERALGTVRTLAAEAAGEWRRPRRLARLWPVVAASERLAMVVRAVPRARRAAEPWRGTLLEFASALRERRPARRPALGADASDVERTAVDALFRALQDAWGGEGRARRRSGR